MYKKGEKVMEILNNWLLYVVLYLVLSTVFTQFFKIATKTLKKAGALTYYYK